MHPHYQTFKYITPMGMSTHIKAFRSTDSPEFQKHKKIANLCMASEVSLPTETADYFNVRTNGPYPEMFDESLEVELIENTHYVRFSEDFTEGYSIAISHLPEDIATLKVYNSY